ncbi:sulfuric ester hydrolase [Aureococcus anophagefferens]|nr:sulfuric ester hydrolase [Aureococcus anophagefferens]
MGLIPSHDEHAPSGLLGEDPYKRFDAPEPPAKSDLTCAVCGEQTKLNCPCGTVAYCSKACQKSDWREGHKKVCKARREGHKKEAADAAAAAPAFGHYIQTPEDKCSLKIRGKPCPLCRKPWPKTHAMMLAYLRQNVDNGVSEAMNQLGDFYRFGRVVAAPNPNKAAKLYTRAIELGNLDAMNNLGFMHSQGDDDDAPPSAASRPGASLEEVRGDDGEVDGA